MLYMLFLIRKSLSPCIPGDSDGKESAYMEKEMATHSSILAWRISWTGSLAGYSPWGCKSQT